MVADYKVNIVSPATDLPGASSDKRVISVRNVSKMYPLYALPSDRLKQSLWYALPEFLRGKPRSFYREFWALRDISFEIKKGEAIGIIGRNGSGKSTLLQIIAGTLTPTSGEVWSEGQILGLLELSTGFNPEFTGRENVYLSGAILGLRQAEIEVLYEDILAFADIGQFIEQPVKLYSSGMRVRLAFALQTFVPKETFIIDEALAVGDEAFQRKCYAALERFKDDGGTVLLVSHNARTVVRQCERCIFLNEGELLADGPSKAVTDLYQKILYSTPEIVSDILTNLRQYGLEYTLNRSSQVAGVELNVKQDVRDGIEDGPVDSEPTDWFDPDMPKTNEVTYGNGDAEIFEYGMYNEAGQQVNVLVTGNTYNWRYKVKFDDPAHKVGFGFVIKTVDGISVAGLNNNLLLQQLIDFIPSDCVVEVTFKIKLNLAPAMYFVNSGVYSEVSSQEDFYLHRRVDLCSLRVIQCDEREIRGLAYLDPSFTYRFLNT